MSATFSIRASSTTSPLPSALRSSPPTTCRSGSRTTPRDGFWLNHDVYEDSIDSFVEGRVPMLQRRDLFHLDYEGDTLQDHPGVPYQYGTNDNVSAP